MKNEQFLRTAILLARMYGVAETLHPWDFLDNEKFISKIESWTEQFLSSGNQDIVKFFETRIIE